MKKTGTKARRHEGTQGEEGTAPVSLRASVPLCLRALRQAFTLIEVLIVIGIIVLLIALAVPALSWISGSRSIDGAENNLSAMLGRARNDAIALQVPTGVMFFIDDASRGVMMAEVYDTGENPKPGDRQVYLELVGDRDFLALPKGVSAQVIDNAIIDDRGTPTAVDDVREDDGYIGYNPYISVADTRLRYGGVVMFDASGRLYNPTYGFDFVVNGTGSRMSELFKFAKGTTPNPAFFDPPVTGTITPTAGYGVVLFDREAFNGGSGAADEDAANRDFQMGASALAQEQGEEKWIDRNSVPLLINRYNGTLVRGE